MSNITEIIDEIPRLLQYFISGFIFLKVFCFLDSKDSVDASFLTIWSVVISFVITSIVRMFDALILPDHELLLWGEILICVSVGLLFSFLIYTLLGSKLFGNLLNKTIRKSVNTDIWRDIIDYDKGTAFKVFLKDVHIIYIGKLMAHEEKGLDSWFVLKDYICMYTDNGEEFDASTSSTPTVVALNLRDVERIELFYDNETKIFG